MKIAKINYRLLRFLLPRGCHVYYGPRNGGAQTRSLYETGFTWLSDVVTDVPALTDEFIRRVPDDSYQRSKTLSEYFRVRDMKGILRSQPIFATENCKLS